MTKKKLNVIEITQGYLVPISLKKIFHLNPREFLLYMEKKLY